MLLLLAFFYGKCVERTPVFIIKQRTLDFLDFSPLEYHQSHRDWSRFKDSELVEFGKSLCGARHVPSRAQNFRVYGTKSENLTDVIDYMSPNMNLRFFGLDFIEILFIDVSFCGSNGFIGFDFAAYTGSGKVGVDARVSSSISFFFCWHVVYRCRGIVLEWSYEPENSINEQNCMAEEEYCEWNFDKMEVEALSLSDRASRTIA